MLDASKNRWAEISEVKSVHEGYLGSYLLYHIRIKDPHTFPDLSLSLKDNSIEVIERRYSDFEFFHNKIKESYKAQILPALPERRLFTVLSPGSSEFNKSRRQDLEIYINKILSNKQLMALEESKRFFSNVS